MSRRHGQVRDSTGHEGPTNVQISGVPVLQTAGGGVTRLQGGSRGYVGKRMGADAFEQNLAEACSMHRKAHGANTQDGHVHVYQGRGGGRERGRNTSSSSNKTGTSAGWRRARVSSTNTHPPGQTHGRRRTGCPASQPGASSCCCHRSPTPTQCSQRRSCTPRSTRPHWE